MNKNELITSVSEASGLSKSDAGKAVDGVIGAITGALKSGGDVRIVGFGTFSVAQRKATTGRNPRTGEPIQIKASKDLTSLNKIRITPSTPIICCRGYHRITIIIILAHSNKRWINVILLWIHNFNKNRIW